MRFYEDVIAPDTFRTKLYLLTDGSFFEQTDHQAPVGYGEIDLFQNGMITPMSMDEMDALNRLISR